MKKKIHIPIFLQNVFLNVEARTKEEMPQRCLLADQKI
jgi:hypothetical protein